MRDQLWPREPYRHMVDRVCEQVSERAECKLMVELLSIDLMARPVVSDGPIYTLASGAITAWLDSCGALMLKVREPSGDPLELAEHEALELAGVMARLDKEVD